MTRSSKILLALALLFIAGAAVIAAIYLSLQNKIDKRLEKGWVIPPLELYSQGFALEIGRKMPLAGLQGVTEIEDKDFLEHSGVRATGIVRAVLRNLRAGRWAEGGSTITQQLVKNFFLSSKKTIRRKIEEQLLALMLEARLS